MAVERRKDKKNRVLERGRVSEKLWYLRVQMA